MAHDSGITPTQSTAIIRYLDEMHRTPALSPGSAAGHAGIRAVSQAIGCEIHPLNNLRVQQWLQVRAGMDPKARSSRRAHRVGEGFRALEATLANSSSTGRFCQGGAPTMADCCLVPPVYNAERFALPLELCPELRRIHSACMVLPALQCAVPKVQADAA